MTQTTDSARPPINWLTAIVFAGTFATAVIAVPWYALVSDFSAEAWAACFLLLGANGMAITGGYHRLWAHRTYQAHWSVRLVYMIFGTMALQNSILVWATDHRRHHRFVDDNDRDPYSAGRGFWFSHIGWMLRHWESGKQDFSNGLDLEQDPIVCWQHRHYLLLAIATNVGLPLLLGFLAGDVWGFFLLAGVLRLVLIHHSTFFINSLAHIWGSRPYSDGNSARDNALLAFLTYGEGYHNFHHSFDRDYRNGIRWWQWDPSKWLIFCLSLTGLAGQLKRVPDVTIQRARLAMLFKRAEAALEKRRRNLHLPDLDAIRERIAREYETFQATLGEWSRLREWYATARRQLAAKSVETRFRSQMREIERQLTLQRRRMRQLTEELLMPGTQARLTGT